jgi:hypothetical protein
MTAIDMEVFKYIRSERYVTTQVEIPLPLNKPIIVGTLYRPHKQTDFKNNLESILSKFSFANEIYIVCTFRCICFPETKIYLFKDIMYFEFIHSSKNYKNTPTRISCTGSSLGVKQWFMIFVHNRVFGNPINCYRYVNIRIYCGLRLSHEMLIMQGTMFRKCLLIC